jgi:isopentenyl-diphosphate delta-isomerase
MEKVILVDTNDNAIGDMEKMQAHIEGKLHRAFSIFVFNDKNQLLIHQRALTKYHSAGLWTNTCCSHPRPNENTLQAANRRLMEEMGLSCELEKHFDFIYKAELENGLTEHEFDHVFVGKTNNLPQPNAHEVMSYKYLDLDSLINDIEHSPEKYTAWFKIAIKEFSNFNLKIPVN